MSENQDIHEENVNTPNENTQNPEAETTENETTTPCSEELLAEERNRYVRLFAEFENYKKRTAKEKMEFAFAR